MSPTDRPLERPPEPPARATDSGIQVLATQPPPGSSLRSQELFDTQLWPSSKPPLGPLRAALVARVADPFAAPAVEPAALAELVKQLNGAEVRALKLLAERGPAPLEPRRSEPPGGAEPADDASAGTSEKPKSPEKTGPSGILSSEGEARREKGYVLRPEEVEPLADALAHRLRVLLLGAELDRLRAAEVPLEPNAPLLAELAGEIHQADERLDPVVARAMKSHEDADLLRAAGASRTSLLRAVHQLENLARRARGETEQALDLRALVEGEAAAGPARKRRSIGRIIVLGTKQVARRLADRRLLYALGVVVAATLVVHAFVLGTFGSPGRGFAQRPAPAGTRQVVAAPDSVRVTVPAGFDMRRDALRVRNALGPGTEPVLFLDAAGRPVGAAAGDQVLELPTQAPEPPAAPPGAAPPAPPP